ncbi:hypothetical protein R1flu_024412 [Riccia fluitans]|uniref:Uncharacterized protein n=1 Tax=Riccia fluitans TaxID=41844 RepID=A0ABD1XUU8_9MARC
MVALEDCMTGGASYPWSSMLVENRETCSFFIAPFHSFMPLCLEGKEIGEAAAALAETSGISEVDDSSIEVDDYKIASTLMIR